MKVLLTSDKKKTWLLNYTLMMAVRQQNLNKKFKSEIQSYLS